MDKKYYIRTFEKSSYDKWHEDFIFIHLENQNLQALYYFETQTHSDNNWVDDKFPRNKVESDYDSRKVISTDRLLEPWEVVKYKMLGYIK